MKQSIEKIPTWAFGYIFNGDMTGLTDEEVRMIDETLKSIGAELVCTPPDEEAQPYYLMVFHLFIVSFLYLYFYNSLPL